MVGDVSLEGTNLFQQLPVLRSAFFNVQDIGQFIHDLERPIDFPVPQVPLEVLKDLLQIGAQLRLLVLMDALGHATHPSQPHRHMKPIQQGLGFRMHPPWQRVLLFRAVLKENVLPFGPFEEVSITAESLEDGTESDD